MNLVDSIEIPTLITEINPNGTSAVHGPQSTNLSNLVAKYPDAIAILITKATPNKSNHFDVANIFNFCFIKHFIPFLKLLHFIM